jgi:hypothetical protein
MPRTADAAARALVAGVLVVVLAATARAGLDGRAIPALSHAIWAATLLAALLAFARAGVSPIAALRRLAWLLPVVTLFALPAALVAPPGRRTAVLLGLAARAFASTAAAAAMATWLGPAGLVAGARALRVPAYLVDVLEAMLASLAGVTRQVTAMLRAREVRRPGHGAWSRVLSEPRATVRGFGRLVASLLLRSLERGEALERARRARGGAE